MATIVLRGYPLDSFWTSTGSIVVAPGDSVRLDGAYDNDTDFVTITITDDDLIFDSDGASDEVGDDATQTATITDSLGATLGSGRVYLEDRVVLSDGAGNTVEVFTVEIGGQLLGTVSIPEMVPGTTYQVVSYNDPTLSGPEPAYADFSDPTYDADDAQSYQGGAYADSFDSGAGADTIYGGGGNDTIYYGSGGATQAEGDTVYGGDGNDTIDDTSGTSYTYDDTLYGEGGDDTIWAGGGDDTIYGGTGNDMLYGEAGNDTIYGGDGNDQVWGGDGNDTLYGGAGSDNVHGEAGDDTIYIYDDDGNTNAYGDSGFDTVVFEENAPQGGVSLTANGTDAFTYTYAGGGASGQINTVESFVLTDSDDTVNGSAQTNATTYEGRGGDDTFFLGSGNDTLVYADGSGNDIIWSFDMGDSNADGFTNDQLDVSGLTDAFGNPVNYWDVVLTSDGSGNSILTFPNGETIVLKSVDITQLDSQAEMAAIGIPCFASGTRILTPSGERAVEDLRAGDQVLTADGHPMEILWHGQRRLSPAELARRPELAPVRIRDGALGNRGDLLVSPQHGLVLPDPRRPLVARDLLRAKHLLSEGDGRFRLARGKRGVTYHHLLLPRHALIFANGALSESLYPGRFALSGFDDAAKAELFDLFPAFADVLTDADPSALYGATALPFARRRDVAALLTL